MIQQVAFIPRFGEDGGRLYCPAQSGQFPSLLSRLHLYCPGYYLIVRLQQNYCTRTIKFDTGQIHNSLMINACKVEHIEAENNKL